MRKPPEKGAVAWLELPETEGVQAGILYVGARKARQWQMQMAKFRVEEVTRLEKLRKAHRKETAPELWEMSITPDGIERAGDLVSSILEEAVAGVRGIEGIEDEDKEAALELLNELDPGEGMELLTKAIEMQSLSKADRFFAQDSR